MKKMITIIALLLALTLVLCSCGAGSGSGSEAALTEKTTVSETQSSSGETKDENSASGAESASQSPQTGSSEQSSAESEYFSNRDYRIEYKDSESAHISLSGSSASADSNAVSVNGSTVTISDEGTYVVSGELEGMIIVDAEKTDKVQIVLSGVSINSETSAAIYVKQADKVFITTAEGTVNTLTNGGSFVAIDDNNIDAVIFSKDDLTLNGAGTLDISSPAGHAVVSKDELTVTSGTYVLSSASSTLAGKDNVCIAGGDFTITSVKDGIHSENDDDSTLGFIYIMGGSFDITAGDDGIYAGAYILIDGGDFTITSADDAVHSNASVTVNGGSFTINAGDDGMHADEDMTVNAGTINIAKSYEGIEGLNVYINGGDIYVKASDDGINAAGGTDQSGFGGSGQDMFGGRGNKMGGQGGFGGMSSGNSTLVISGGNIHINANGDGIDANGSFSMTGGYVIVCGPTQGDTSVLDFDATGSITGGTFIGSGASMMAQSFSSSEQGVISLSVGSRSAGTEISVSDASGNTVLSYTPELPYQIVILSSEDLVSGQSYTVNIGSQSASVTAN